MNRRRGPLGAGELAEAVVLADLTLVLSILGQVLPYFGGALLVVAVVPMAALGARNRLRAVVVGAIAASTVGFLVLGTPVVTSVVACAALGAVVGGAARRGWGMARTVGAAALFLWPIVAVGMDLLLFVLSAYRKLVLDQIRNSWSGVAHVLRSVGTQASWLNLDPVVRQGNTFVADVLRAWWASIPIALFVVVVTAAALAQRITAPTLRRVRAAFATTPDDGTPDDGTPDDEPDDDRAADPVPVDPVPVPVELRAVSYRYPGADTEALRDVSLEVAPGELVAVIGPNGSGKSTLARVLAGRRPTSGEVVRPGPTGLGMPGGTAIVFQRPELQVLGVRVRDDVVWGLAQPERVDVAAMLDRVGLASFADRETSTLSGGELQRLAVAAALARRPQLLISDESTAMVDSTGRGQLVSLLRALAADDHIAVVHVTHRAAETAAADRAIALEGGRVVAAPSVAESDATAARSNPKSRVRPSAGPLLILRDVGHVYSRRTPWAHRALAGIDLRIDHGEAVLVVGHNGSGKSTLAWVLAGLLDPSEGEARIEGRPLASVVGQVGVAFQHARLQLLRPTVAAEVCAASGASNFEAWEALRAVGLDPRDLGPRRVDELSGGQARRVVLAGAIAAHPRALVLDEPFAGLDDHGRVELSAALARLRSERGMTLVCVSHDRDLPAVLVDREVELVEGRIAYDGPGRSTDHDVARGNLP